MFSWLVSSKKHDQIPTPPPLDYEVANFIRKTVYDPNYYCHPENLNEEIRNEYNRRNIDRQIDELIAEIQNVDVNNGNSEVDDLIRETEEYIENFETDVPEWNSSSEETPNKRQRASLDSFEPSTIDNVFEQIQNPNWQEWTPNPAFDSEELLAMESGIRNGVPVEDLKEVVVETPQEINQEREVTIEDMNRISREIEKWGDSDYDDMPSLEEIEEIEESEEKMIPQNKIETEEMMSQDARSQSGYPQREHPEGYLEIFMGPMYSGKSTKAFFKLSSMADQRFSCLYINSKKDVRKTESNDDNVSTHNSSYSRPSPKITCVKVSKLSEVNVNDYQYIAVDELQFFEDAFQNILDWLNEGKYVIVASLDGDCYRRKFGEVLDLIPHANSVTKLTAYCDICRDNYKTLVPAPFTARMTNDTSAELVGGTDLYKAMCRNCHDFHLDVTSSYL